MNVLLIGIDTLRADHLGCYDYFRPTSPNIDKLASEGLLFDRCNSQAPWTIPSFTTILTGNYPETHGIVGSPWNVPNANNINVDDNMPMLAEILLDNGYETMAIDNLHQMGSHPKWFVRGFNHYVNLTPRTGLYHHHVLADDVYGGFSKWLDQFEGDKFFGFLHFWEPHLPYNQPNSYNELFSEDLTNYQTKLEDESFYIPNVGPSDLLNEKYSESVSNYDREIKYIDDYIGKVRDLLEAKGIADETIIVLTGDHGESMFEHEVLFDHFELYNATVHVPLIIFDPRNKNKSNGSNNSLVEHVDIVPTILDLVGAKTVHNFDGVSLKPQILGENGFNKEFTHAIQDGGSLRRMIRNDEWKYIVFYDKENGTESHKLFNLNDDPFEVFECSASNPEVVKKMREAMFAWLKEILSKREDPRDPLFRDDLTVNFLAYPGDPVLVEFYQWLKEN